MPKKPSKLKISNAWKAPMSTLASAALSALILKTQGLTWENAGIAAGIVALGGVLPDPKVLQSKPKAEK
jgi:hypothetical protein